ncbi:MAG: glycoside hydrolase/phage tail family protein [Pseudomonadota bacterium]|nr:glycoside hydrolase/phage tail family protein [Pseudomonadota bacterium]
MATVLLSAAGAAIGGSIGGTVLGLSAVAAGRFVGATLGRAIDQRLMGQGAETIETGRIERFRLSGASEGSGMPRVYGRMRVGGQVIWAGPFIEKRKTSGGGGGKGSSSQPTVKTYSYSVSVAIALCEGEITSVNRVWADGDEIAVPDLNMRVYKGDRNQLPDPKIEAFEGTGNVPAYRGTAYVVFEDLQLEQFGNRIPQFSFEVTRPSLDEDDVPHQINAVALLPGSGEYALSTTPRYKKTGTGKKTAVNVHSPSEQADFVTSLNMLADEAPNCRAVSVVVSWFGDDLRAGHCTLRPKVEQTRHEIGKSAWRVSGLSRSAAQVVPSDDDGIVYGGTPNDASVIEAIQAIQAKGQEVMFYPFILMDQLAGNGLVDPWSGGADQPALPWRGRITTSLAPNIAGTTDGTAAARSEVEAFFGTVTASDFTVGSKSVGYSGPDEWGFRRFILHYAALCKVAGGVESFCIGSEMRGLTQIRDDQGFPAVDQLRDLAAEVRAILGPDAKIGYAADWSEYFGYQPQDGSGDVYFHLDPLWADPNIDFIGIDNYMPLSDWRDGRDHADADWGHIHNVDYLKSNVEGGEGYDWYYPSPEAVAAQRRVPITDGAHGEDWIYRYKDIRSWWTNSHHNRVAGVRSDAPTAWEPQSKPIWFTELGCAAIDKGTNQPNVFLDPKSSESHMPRASNGRRDDLIQRQYLRAMHGYWGDPANNPVSVHYEAPMIDMTHAFVWAWDARPYPWFPSMSDTWSDGGNYRRGHWITGRISGCTLASVVEDICARCGVTEIDVSSLHGFVRGFHEADVASGRAALQSLMLAYGFDAVERDGVLRFQMRTDPLVTDIDPNVLVISGDLDGALSHTRANEAEMAGRVRLRFFEADGDHAIRAEEVVHPEDETHSVSESELPLSMTSAEGRQTLERWLAESRIARDTLRFGLPPSQSYLGAGDVIRIESAGLPITARIDRIEQGDYQQIDATRIEPAVHDVPDFPEAVPALSGFTPVTPVLPMFMDLPLMRGDEAEHAPYMAVTADPWPGAVALYSSSTDAGYEVNTLIEQGAIIGETETVLSAAMSGLVDRGDDLQIKLVTGNLESVTEEALLSGANMMAIGDGSPDNWEIFQFRDATLVAADTWRLGHRLRGQFGTDGVMPREWPVGSYVVLLDGSALQISLAASAKRQLRHYRIGPASRPYDDPSYEYVSHAFNGNGARPYRPAHLQARDVAGDISVSWVRRTRIDGDSWDLSDVPLGESNESYHVRIKQAGQTVRETVVSQAGWTYTQAQRASDLVAGEYSIEVAQVSEIYGSGPYAQITLS